MDKCYHTFVISALKEPLFKLTQTKFTNKTKESFKKSAKKVQEVLEQQKTKCQMSGDPQY